MKKMLIALSALLLVGSASATTLKDKVSYKDAPARECWTCKYFVNNMSGNLTLVSNYVFRGVSQSRNLPALQGGLTYTLPVGIYFNVWGSNVNFNDSSGATVELDAILGYGNSIGDDFTYDINVARYTYPGARQLNYNEINTLFNWKFLQAGISYSGNVYNAHRSGTYYSAGINYNIPPRYFFNWKGVNVLALFGHYSLPEAAGKSYNDYSVALNKEIKHYTLTLQWTDTNGRYNNPPFDGSQIIGMLAANF